jgi:hypothetical protein
MHGKYPKNPPVIIDNGGIRALRIVDSGEQEHHQYLYSAEVGGFCAVLKGGVL